jgi:hypothetical protein
MDTGTHRNRRERSGGLSRERGNGVEKQQPGKSKTFSPTQTTLLSKINPNNMDKAKSRTRMGDRMGKRDQRTELVQVQPDPGHKALEPHREAPKSISSIITQLRTGKIGLNAYLHSRKVPGIDNPNCGCGYRLQSIEHVLLGCRKYRQLRRSLLGPGYKTLGEVLSTPKLTLKAAEFMVATRLLGQFRRPDEEEIYNE